jgi:acyl-CoA synthetase (AMP-forming)/AMP-acid ligase II
VTSYAHGAVSQPLLGETISANLDRTVATWGDREALVSRHQELRYTYAELGAAVDRVARALIAAGLGPGDRVGIWSPNCAEWVLVQYATAKAGIVLVNINPAYRSLELAFVLKQSGCRALIAARSFKTSDYVAMVAEVRGELAELERVVFLESPDWEELLAGADAVGEEALAERQAATQFDDAINIQYTSGTTGFPKGATLSHHNILNNGCTGIMAGSPCPIDVMRRVVSEMHMEEVTICYGMTETSPVSTQTAVDDPLAKRVGTVGRVHPHVEVKVVHPESGQLLPRGEPGELCTRGYSVMLGYWDEPQRTAEAIDQGRWMHTGDLATMDDEGYLNIVGRIKDMVIRGGENVYPREIEEFLYGHPDIADVQVVGVPDERYGEELAAWIVPRGGATVDLASIKSFCEGKIAHYKVPRHVLVLEEFPMTVTGKVQKFKLREMAVEELSLVAAAGVKTA